MRGKRCQQPRPLDNFGWRVGLFLELLNDKIGEQALPAGVLDKIKVGVVSDLVAFLDFKSSGRAAPCGGFDSHLLPPQF